ncbi:D-alanyl-D-alanine carboxypeptidase [Mesorhizobium sp. L-8-10]|uniref:D-alanyl-D-alanine carboxypeptidase family protein n=1 Tax=unclassified Mesorhizobium TaxID=325217 RepID=UPI001928803F|nr:MULTISPECIES: D-alanyl-D-alanine carboxypeptidase family protein [unclassified Mesorhizobium]BCH21957.1 D-alanyl-D-alanine carboxypeptidase [Mesorhizobium sp. L-8-3]BCH29651.1 D-alanyl-D-alanine carboxypeptidase [Mesorhizobium sp. L-8-10]
MAGTHFFRRALTGILLLAAAPAAASPSILFDAKSGKVLAHEDAFKRWHPASLTKLMTAYVTFRALKAGELQLDSPIRMTKHAAGEPPSKMGYKPGSVMTLDNALKMMIIKSANDVAMAVGENVGGSQEAFAARMNAEAARLGMTDSHFVNPNGLHSPDQYATARDLGLLVMAIRNEFPEYASYFSIEGLLAGKKRLMSYNMLVGRFEGADGMKTGFICESGFNLVGTATRDGRTLAVVVLGQKSAVTRTDYAAGLLERGFAATGTQSQTLTSLAAYGMQDPGPVNMRPEVCDRKQAAAQSEAAGDHEAKKVKSRWLEKIANPKLVAVGLGKATGPVPLAWRDRAEEVDVPIPTPRPVDGTPIETKADARVKAAAGVN